jgi:GNAT superfamily N-acetyltransferase
MLVENPGRRLFAFYRRHGLRATGARFGAALKHLPYLGRMVLFSCPLPVDRSKGVPGISIERVSAATVSKEDYARVLDVWNFSTRARQLAQRFAAASELWLAKANGDLAGFGWSIQGRTVEPYFFPLQPEDVHLFDFFVFPEYRGRGINVLLIMEILSRLSGEPVRRAHIECTAWNRPQLRSLSKTPFRRYAEAAKVTALGRSLVIWHRFE